MPFAFPHAHLDGHSFVDGGTVWNVDIVGAIERCREIVDNDEDIIVDTILCNGAQNITRDEHKKYNTIQNYMRFMEIRHYYGFLSDYFEVKRDFANVNFRYMLVPEEDLPSGMLTLDFKHECILEMIEIGKREGKKAIDEGPQASHQRAKDSLKRSMYYQTEI